MQCEKREGGDVINNSKSFTDIVTNTQTLTKLGSQKD